MPNTKSVKKTLRQSKKRRLRNLRRTSALKRSVRDFNRSLGTENKEESLKLLSNAYKAIDKSAKNGIIKKNTAGRKKSLLAKKLSKEGMKS